MERNCPVDGDNYLIVLGTNIKMIQEGGKKVQFE